MQIQGIFISTDLPILLQQQDYKQFKPFCRRS